MSREASRLARRKRAKAWLNELQRNEESSVAIHYSCESFYDRPDGSSPRITSIAIRNLATEQTRSFSIHLVAERNGVALSEIANHYDKLEKQMLDEYFEYVRLHQQYRWIHWVMRDVKYGFPAIEHRYQVLGGQPTAIEDSRKFNLASILVDLYGSSYVEHPRLLNVMRLNAISEMDFLDGTAEANAFTDGEFVKLHQSTLRKVDNLVAIYERTVRGELKTKAKLRDIYGGVFPWLVGHVQEHWLFVLLAVIGSIASLIGLALAV